MNDSARLVILALAATALSAATVPVLAQDIVIDSVPDDTVITRIGNGPQQPHPVCADNLGAVGTCSTIRVDSLTGNTGIGPEPVVAAQAPLHVRVAPAGAISDLPATALLIEGDSSTYAAFHTPSNFFSGILFRQPGGPDAAIVYTAGANQLALATAGVQRLVIAEDGNVGILVGPLNHPLAVGFDSSNGNGAHVTAGGVWTNGSDRNSKEDFQQIDRQDVLTRLVSMPVTQWRYKGEDQAVSHIGPVAQDFSAAFGLGESDTHIGTVDADGVAMVAIQALHEQLQEKERQIVDLTDRLERLEKMVGSR